MPDTKFSWPALKEHLRKYLWIYLVGVALCLAGTDMLWTMTRPQIPAGESVLIYMVDSYANPDPLSDIADDMLARGQAIDDTLKLVEFQSLQYTDPEVDYTGSMLLVTRLAMGEGDAFLAGAEAMDALVVSNTLLPLDDYVKDGWLAEYGLEPFYATAEDEEAGTSETYMAGLKLDNVDALRELSAFDNQDACLAVFADSGNLETTMKTLEIMLEDLTEASHASTESP